MISKNSNLRLRGKEPHPNPLQGEGPQASRKARNTTVKDSLGCTITITPTRHESVGCDDGRFISPKESIMTAW